MKKIVLSVVVVAGFVFYSLHERFGLFADDEANFANSPLVMPTPSLVKEVSIPQATSLPVTTSFPTPKGQYRDGTYTGSSADAYYGNVQVKVVISGGKITDVIFLDYPQDRRTSVLINQQAMPLLKQEVISAQSANVNTISGASQTSRGFRASLSSALSQAKT